MGIFYLIHRYLGIVKSFQTLHVHMNNADRNGYKTVTFITKIFFFSNFFVTLIFVCVYVYIYICCSSMK